MRMLSYMQMHLYYTLPPTIILYLLMRPFLGIYEKIKIIALCALALAYSVPLGNYIIYHKALWYRKDAVLGTFGYMPIEQYLLIIIQTIFTSLWSSLCMRWTLHSLFLKPVNRTNFYSIRYAFLSMFVVIMSVGWIYAVPLTKTFYLGSMTWSATLIVILIWYGAGVYVAKRSKVMLISVLVPSVYLCFVDLIALRARIWHIDEATSLGIFPVNGLPIEQIIFVFITNVIIVMGAAAFDKSKAIIDTYYREPLAVRSNASANARLWRFMKMMTKGFLCNEQHLDPTVIDDLKTCSVLLYKASKSFIVASSCFSTDIRQDLTILLTFFRLTDDIIDNDGDLDLKRQRLRMILQFLDQIFANRRITSEYCWELNGEGDPVIDWKYFEKNLTCDQLASFRAIARIAYYMPQEPFYDLVEGFKWDTEARPVLNENDLLEYSKYVASSIATLFPFIFCHKTNQWPDKMGPKCKLLHESARKMGLVRIYSPYSYHFEGYAEEKVLRLLQALQIVNIARDIVTDSKTLGRCYIPNNYLEMNELKYLTTDRTPNRIPNSRLKELAERMLDSADNLANESLRAINLFPPDCQRAALSLLEICHAIGTQIRKNPFYERRTRLPNSKRIRIALKCMYFTNLTNDKFSTTFYEDNVIRP